MNQDVDNQLGGYEPERDKCPRCGGVADNGHDREYPPNPYLCSACHDDIAAKHEHTPGIGRNASLDLKRQDSTADALSEECKESVATVGGGSNCLVVATAPEPDKPAPAANALKQLSYAVAYAERNGRSPRATKQDQHALEIMQHLVLTASSVLYHDERGQGVGYSESMQELNALVGDTTRETLKQIVGEK